MYSERIIFMNEAAKKRQISFAKCVFASNKKMEERSKGSSGEQTLSFQKVQREIYGIEEKRARTLSSVRYGKLR
jgi:hypothetical protein